MKHMYFSFTHHLAYMMPLWSYMQRDEEVVLSTLGIDMLKFSPLIGTCLISIFYLTTRFWIVGF